MISMKRKYHEEIRVAREGKGWTQKDLAVELGTTQQNVGRWEKGTIPSSKWRNGLKKMLGIDFEDENSADANDASDLICRPLRSLPFTGFNEYDFEKFIADVLSCMGEDFMVYGVRGNKQDGVDVIPMSGMRAVAQCKCVKKFGETEARGVVEEYIKGGIVAERKILAIAVQPVKRAMDLLKKNGWDIWTPDVITRKIRYELTENQKRELVRDYFSDNDVVLEECLGLEPDSCFVKVSKHFNNIKDGLIDYDNVYQFIAEDSLHEIVDYLSDDASRIIVLSGVGGVGKTRRLKELAELAKNKEMLLLKDGQDCSGRELARALRNESVVVVDDAHKLLGRAFNRMLVEYVGQNIDGKKMIITTRQHAKERVLEAIRRSGVSEDAIVEYDINVLKGEDAFNLASSIIGDNNAFLTQLVKVSGGNALLITMGGKLLNKKGIIPAKLLNESDGKQFIRGIFETYLDEGFAGSKEGNAAKSIMGVLSVVQPCAMQQLFEIAQKEFGNRYNNIEIRKMIDKLVELGLIRVSDKVWISPDLLADYECETMLLDDKGEDNGVLDEILALLPDGNIDLFCNVLQNVCQLDWRTKMLDGSTLLKQKLWARFGEMIVRADTGGRMGLIDALREVAYFSPGDALATVDLVIKNPSVIESKRYDGETITNNAVEDKLAKVLLSISYNEEYLEIVLDKVVEIAKARQLVGASYQDFVDIFKEIARYEIHKPVVYTEQVVNYVLSKSFEAEFPFEMYDILGECLKTNGSSILSRGKIKMEIRPFNVRLELVQKFRRRIIKHMIESINGDDKKLAILAAGLIRVSLGIANDDEWKTERVWVLERLYNDLEYDKLGPVLAAVIRAELNFILNDVAEARNIIEKIPVSLDNELARGVVDAWGHSTFYGEYETNHARYVKWLKSLAARLVKTYSCSKIASMVRDCLADLKYYNSNAGEEYAANIFRALSDESEVFCKDFINIIVKEREFEGLIGNSLISLVMVHGKVDEAIEATERVLAMDDAVVLQSVAQFLIISIDVLPLKWTASVFKTLLENKDVMVRRRAIDALRLLPKEHCSLAIDLINAVELAPEDQELLCAVEEIVNSEYGVMDVQELSEEMRKKIEKALICKPDLGYAEIGFIQDVVKNYPIEIIKLMVERCRRFDELNTDRWNYQYSPVPYNGALKVEEKVFRMVVSVIMDYSSTPKNSIHFFGTRLIRFFGGNQEEMVGCILDILPKVDDVDMAKMLLRALPLSVLWDNDVVDRVEVSVSSKMPTSVIADSLFGLIFDDNGGAHVRTIGVPGEFELELRDNSEKMLEKCDNATLRNLYLRINKYAKSELARQRKDDEDLMRA